VQWERILDANLNRLNESLKLIEDITRFVIEDRRLLTEVRRVRTRYLTVKKSLPLLKLVQYRDSRQDPGAGKGFDTNTRRGMIDTALSNFTRAKESARIIEEILKSVYPELSSEVKQVRFAVYDMEKSALLYFQKVFDPRIYVLLDNAFVRKSRLGQITEILRKNGATMIQLRITSLSDRQFLDYARVIRKILKHDDIKFIINNRVDIALACNADGVHLGQNDLPVAVCRSQLGKAGIIGISAHNISEAKKAEKQGADYLGVGSIFKTLTKTDARVCGLHRLKAICRSVSIPVVGIGGINRGNYRQVLKHGASGIALASYLFNGDLKKNLRSLTAKK
jgi:thiamine-phosphate pyrophosphorylase